VSRNQARVNLLAQRSTPGYHVRLRKDDKVAHQKEGFPQLPEALRPAIYLSGVSRLWPCDELGRSRALPPPPKPFTTRDRF